jgi:hypothetical protein
MTRCSASPVSPRAGRLYARSLDITDARLGRLDGDLDRLSPITMVRGAHDMQVYALFPPMTAPLSGRGSRTF